MTIGEQLIDVSKSYVPIAVLGVLLVIVFQIGQAYRDVTSTGSSVGQQLVEFKTQYNSDLASLRVEITALAKGVTDLRGSLLDPTRGIPADVVRGRELYVFCLELERANQNLKCPITMTTQK